MTKMDIKTKALNRALMIINQYAKITVSNSDIRDHVHDLMIDLCHLLDDRNYDPQKVFSSSLLAFEEESEESTH
jgi:hypothetical protein